MEVISKFGYKNKTLNFRSVMKNPQIKSLDLHTTIKSKLFTEKTLHYINFHIVIEK